MRGTALAVVDRDLDQGVGLRDAPGDHVTRTANVEGGILLHLAVFADWHREPGHLRVVAGGHISLAVAVATMSNDEQIRRPTPAVESADLLAAGQQHGDDLAGHCSPLPLGHERASVLDDAGLWRISQRGQAKRCEPKQRGK